MSLVKNNFVLSFEITGFEKFASARVTYLISLSSRLTEKRLYLPEYSPEVLSDEKNYFV